MAKREVNLGNVTGPKGDSIFWLEVDASGNLYATYQDGAVPPVFEYETATGNLYLVVT